MADNWDDDDFEPEVSTFVRVEPEPIKPVDVEEKKEVPKVKTTAKKTPVFAMENLGRELSSAEKEEMQKKNDLALAMDLLGDGGASETSSGSYANASSVHEFEYWGERFGSVLATRHNAANYGSMVGTLLRQLTENMTPAEIQKMITYLQSISSSKKNSEKKKEKIVAPVAAVKKNKKAQLKVSKATENLYDYNDDVGDDYDEYDDFM